MTARRLRMALFCFVVVMTAAVVIPILMPGFGPPAAGADILGLGGLSGVVALVLVLPAMPILAVVSALRGDASDVRAAFVGTIVGMAGAVAVFDRVLVPDEFSLRTVGFSVAGALLVAIPVGVTFAAVGAITLAIVGWLRARGGQRHRRAAAATTAEPSEMLPTPRDP